ncbi:Ubiquitin-conjugating enzyme subunit, variant 3 [Batrachochytrium dendrobatidis]|nr:Ubiquitin-conjugating enzyme subunit, variant 3 [Batrachochytrium dendrobatidis]
MHLDLSHCPIPGFNINLKDDDIFTWEIGVIGPPKTIYESGYFLSTMCFPSDYPFNPPSFKFNRPFFHPNVYSDGRICISILHPPGDDPLSGEKAEERWNPTQTVESILLSVVSLLNDPNCSSPANVDAGVMYRQDHDQYCLAVKNQVEISRRDIPDGYELPTSDEHYAVRKPVENTIEDEDFWYDEDEEDLEDEDED